MASQNYTDLVAWQKAMDLLESLYKVAREFPREELFGLTSQLRRAAISIPSNIAEGQGRNSSGDFRRFLSIAHGSVREVETHIHIANRLGYIEDAQRQMILSQCAEVGRLVRGLSNSLPEKNSRRE
ncbi:MAG: four helix bundle protein [Isosphaerales bacterium]